MAILIPNSFSSYDLTEEETLQGSILTLTQQQLIQNYRSVLAEEKLALEYDPANPQIFLQREAGLAGQLAALNYLLDMSESARLALLQRPE